MSKLVRYEPDHDLWDASRAFDRLFDEAASLLRSAPLSNLEQDWLAFPSFAGDNLSVDMYETDKDIVVQAALPGVSEGEVGVEERQGILTIRASHKREDERQQSGWQIRERRYGAWQRTLQLPEAVKGDKARAELRDGILTVTLPKVQPARKLVNRIKVSLPKLSLPRLGKKEKTIKVTH